MPPTGPDLIAAIVGKKSLMDVANCPGVPVQIGCAVYGSVQNDQGKGTVISTARDATAAVGAGGLAGGTAVWHFALTPTHHFVVVPWYQHDGTPGHFYTVLMAYENQYGLRKYVKGSANGIAPASGANGGKGYKPIWTTTELAKMFTDLLTKKTAWEEYFGSVGQTKATDFRYWKYGRMALDQAIQNVNNYP